MLGFELDGCFGEEESNKDEKGDALKVVELVLLICTNKIVRLPKMAVVHRIALHPIDW